MADENVYTIDKTPGPDMPDPPARTDLKAILLWCSRWLAPGGGFYRGRVVVSVDYLRVEERATVKSTKALTGLDRPKSVRLGGTLFADESDLLRRFLGDGERAILTALASLQPCMAKDVADAVQAKRISRGEFFALWKNLQVRDLVAERADGRFELAHEWIRGIVGET